MKFRKLRPAPAKSRTLNSKHRRRAFFESLEDRALMATFTWTGVTDGAWNTAGNWAFVSGTDNGVAGIPDSGDNAQFIAPTANLTVTVANPTIINDLSFTGTAAGYNITGSFLAATGTFTQSASGVNTVSSGVIVPGALNVNGAGSSIISGTIYDGAFQSAELAALGANGTLWALDDTTTPVL